MTQSNNQSPSPMDAYEKYIDEMARSIEENGPTFDEDTRECRLCGCTQYNACPGGCSWISDDLCSQCYEQNLLISNYLNSFVKINRPESKATPKMVLIENNQDNREAIHYLTCIVNREPHNPDTFTPGMKAFLDHCSKKTPGYLDITYLTEKCLDIEKDKHKFIDNSWVYQI